MAVQRCIPASVRELVLLVEHTEGDEEKLALKHLSCLTALHLRRRGDEPIDFDEDLSVYLQLTGDLPDSLQVLGTAVALSDVILMQASQLRVLQLLEFPQPPQNSCMAMLESKRLAQLTRLEVLQYPDDSWPFEGLNDELVQQLSSPTVPVYVPHLRLKLPARAMDPALVSSCFEALASLITLTQLTLQRTQSVPRSAAGLPNGNGVGAHAWDGRVEQLATALERLTNLEELSLCNIGIADSSGVERPTGLDWLPVVKVIARLPKLQRLHMWRMPLHGAVAALAHAQHLTRLALADCSLSLTAFAEALSNLACKERLHTCFATGKGWSCPDIQALLSAIVQNLTGLRDLDVRTNQPVVALLRRQYDQLRRGLKHLETLQWNDSILVRVS